MPAFVKGGGSRTPFGKNQYLRSTQDVKLESFTCAASTVPARTIDGNAGQKVLQPGTIMAKITSGPEAGKVGPVSAAATDGREDPDNIVGINDTFLPWQLIERDVEVACAYQCTAVQAWCKELDGTNAEVPLSNATADAMRGGKFVNVNFV